MQGFNQFNENLADQLTGLQRLGKETSVYEQTLRDIERTYKDLDPLQKQELLNTAAAIDAQKKFNETYEKTRDFIRDTLDVLSDPNASFGEKMKSIFGGITDSLRYNFTDKLSTGIAQTIFGINVSKSDNPVIGEIQTSNNFLKQIVGILS